MHRIKVTMTRRTPKRKKERKASKKASTKKSTKTLGGTLGEEKGQREMKEMKETKETKEMKRDTETKGPREMTETKGEVAGGEREEDKGTGDDDGEEGEEGEGVEEEDSGEAEEWEEVEEGCRIVTMYHVLNWKDDRLPPSMDFMHFLLEKFDEEYRNRSAGPPIVHCSAGVGRTGVLISLHLMMEQLISLRDDFRLKTRLEGKAREDEKASSDKEKAMADAHSAVAAEKAKMDRKFDFLTNWTKKEKINRTGELPEYGGEFLNQDSVNTFITDMTETRDRYIESKAALDSARQDKAVKKRVHRRVSNLFIYTCIQLERNISH